jgi:hypothetical protein
MVSPCVGALGFLAKMPTINAGAVAAKLQTGNRRPAARMFNLRIRKKCVPTLFF